MVQRWLKFQRTRGDWYEISLFWWILFKWFQWFSSDSKIKGLPGIRNLNLCRLRLVTTGTLCNWCTDFWISTLFTEQIRFFPWRVNNISGWSSYFMYIHFFIANFVISCTCQVSVYSEQAICFASNKSMIRPNKKFYSDFRTKWRNIIL